MQNVVHSLKLSSLDKEVADLNLGDVVTLEDASWYSPVAANCFKPLAEMIICRECYNNGELQLAQYGWLAGLATNRMLIRRKGTYKWSLVVGVAFDCLVKTLDVTYSLGVGLAKLK